MQEISEWFTNGCDYDSGVALYRRIGTDPALISLFEEDYTEFKQGVLEKALSELLESSNAEVDPGPDFVASESKKFDLPAQVKRVHEWPNERDEYLQSLYEEWRPIFRKLKHFQHTIYEVALRSAEEAGKMAHQIMDLDVQCESIYQRRDSYIKNGIVEPSTPGTTVVDPIKWPLMLQNAERYVRRYKRLVEKNPTDRKKIDLLRKYEQEVIYYRKLLKID